MTRKHYTYVCADCAKKRGMTHEALYGTIIGGRKAMLIRTASTRLKFCFDCHARFRDIYRLL